MQSQARIYPLTVIEVLDMLISGKEKLATELVVELRKFERNKRKV